MKIHSFLLIAAFMFFASITYTGGEARIQYITEAQAAQTESAKSTRDAYAPWEESLQITGNDSTTYDPPLRGCQVETAGNIEYVSPKNTSGASVTQTVIVGQTIPALMTQVKTGTTATIICGR